MTRPTRDAAEGVKDDRASALLAPFAAMGGDWAMPAYHDLEEDIVVWGPSAGRYVTAGDVRAARRYLDGGAADEPDYRPALATPPVPAGEPRCPHGSWQGTYCPHCGGNRAVFGAQRGLPPLTPPVPAGDERERLAALLPCEDPEEPCDADGRDEHRWCDNCIARSVIARTPGVRLTEGSNQARPAQAWTGCGCTADAELLAGGRCPACGHRDHGRGGCSARVLRTSEGSNQ